LNPARHAGSGRNRAAAEIVESQRLLAALIDPNVHRRSAGRPSATVRPGREDGDRIARTATGRRDRIGRYASSASRSAGVTGLRNGAWVKLRGGAPSRDSDSSVDQACTSPISFSRH
jgi:hypothetical protein